MQQTEESKLIKQWNKKRESLEKKLLDIVRQLLLHTGASSFSLPKEDIIIIVEPPMKALK